MAKRSVLGLFPEEQVDTAADAMEALADAGYNDSEYEVLTGTPYPEGTFGEAEPVHKLFRWPLMGAACGFVVGLLVTAGSQLAYPLVTGGKPILSVPPMAIIMYGGHDAGGDYIRGHRHHRRVEAAAHIHGGIRHADYRGVYRRYGDGRRESHGGRGEGAAGLGRGGHQARLGVSG